MEVIENHQAVRQKKNGNGKKKNARQRKAVSTWRLVCWSEDRRS